MVKGFIEIHKRFVLKANSLGLLDPDIKELPKNRRNGIIVVADSTFLITSGSTKGRKDEKVNGTLMMKVLHLQVKVITAINMPLAIRRTV